MAEEKDIKKCFDWGHARRFNTYSGYFRKIYGERIQKVSIDAGFTCPNRDGTKGSGGCIYCDSKAFNPSYCNPIKSVKQQIEEGIMFHKKRYPGIKSFLAYFQAYTNTYAPLEKLAELWKEALDHPAVAGLIIGTRPDCVDREKLSWLKKLSEKYYISVEYGIESCYNKTLRRINRGHTFEDALEALKITNEFGLNTGAHFIFGLPGETTDEMLHEATIISHLPLKTVKFHQLQIIKGTVAERQYYENPSDFNLFEWDEYLDFIIKILERLNPAIVVERFTGEVPPGYLSTQPWGKKRSDQIVRLVEKRMEELDTWQGKYYMDNDFLIYQMDYFLQVIAGSLYNKYGNTLNRHCMVFPNRRAGLYFMKYLSDQISKPIWAPGIKTINELFCSISYLNIAETESLLIDLYKIYRRTTASPESFDEFYYWGSVILNDFDDIDKYLVNPALLFSNIKDVKDIEMQFGGLTEEQIEIIRKFWVSFNPDKKTNEKDEFLKIWSVLNIIYSEFKAALKAKGLAYEGMIFREVADEITSGKAIVLKWDIFHFIGFNALNRCEQILMKHLKDEGKACFYWDYDDSYISSGKFSSAGLFIRENIKKFGNDMPEKWQYKTLLSSGKNVVSRKVINTSSDVAQVKMLPNILASFHNLNNDDSHHTAIILADENLLPAVLTSIPESLGDVNITMGYPLKFSGVYSFAGLLLNLHKKRRIQNDEIYFHYTDVLKIIRSDFVVSLAVNEMKEILDRIISQNLLWISASFLGKSELTRLIFKRINTPVELNTYLKEILLLFVSTAGNGSNDQKSYGINKKVRNELIYRIILALNKLNTILEGHDIDFTLETYLKIVDTNLRSVTVPFTGEPLKGIQIMGLLETRALDFRNLVIVSVNEGILPSPVTGSSFIPFNLRTSFGMPDINHQESIYAYHFYRLLHRAENVVFLYNSNSEGLRAGEMSRFLLQLKYNEDLAPQFFFHDFQIRTPHSVKRLFERNAELNSKLSATYNADSGSALLSPTAINTWLNCSMKFYYRYVFNLREKDELVPEIDHALMGDMLHEIMCKIYKDFAGMLISSDEIERIKENRKFLKSLIDDVVSEKFTRMPDEITAGNELIAKEILHEYLNKLLLLDISVTPFTIIELEKYSDFILTDDSTGRALKFRLGGKIDRIDNISSAVRIVDYKTGRVSENISSVAALFEEDREKTDDAWLQILLYCEAYLSSHPGIKVRPSVYRIRESAREGLNDKLIIKEGRGPELVIEDYGTIRNEFIGFLTSTVNRMLLSQEPFRMTSKIETCNYCPYAGLCMRH